MINVLNLFYIFFCSTNLVLYIILVLPVQLKYYRTIDSMAMNTHEIIIDCEIADTDVEQIQ